MGIIGSKQKQKAIIDRKGKSEKFWLGQDAEITRKPSR